MRILLPVRKFLWYNKYMAQYKVPQDVEADDKLLGPFSFRQFVYLLIAAGLIALAVGLAQLFPLLAILPLPPVLLLLALALPLKKDQPMETYLAAIVSFYIKPRTRRWMAGQRETTIQITAPKIVEDVRTRDLSQEEATHRLSFLADIVDTEGYAIKGSGQSSMKEDLVAEANATSDMFDTYQATALGRAAADDTAARHAEAIAGMKEAIARNENFLEGAVRQELAEKAAAKEVAAVKEEVAAVEEAVVENPVENSESVITKVAEKVVQEQPKQGIIDLANNPDLTVATIAKEANRINRKDDEIFISLH